MSNKPVAALTGTNGQCGAQLTKKLLSEGYRVFGMIRPSSNPDTSKIDDVINDPNLELVYGDLSDTCSINNFVNKCKPHLFLNLGAMSHVLTSFSMPEFVMDVDGTGVVRCLEAIRLLSPNTRFLQFSTSELFGSTVPNPNHSERSPMAPCSPYAFAKLAGFWAVKNYRSSYNMMCFNGIFSNMESKYRSPEFLTRKCTLGAARIFHGLQNELVLGNLDAERSWNYVGDSLDACMLIINSDTPDDYVVGGNEKISVRTFVDKVFTKLGLDWKQYVRTDPKFYRPQEVNSLEPDSTKLRTKLGWAPKYSVDDIIDEMLENDLLLAKKEKFLLDHPIT
jgi:GDPmannose 4,6-dehydratase